jgi:dsDNA-specific endonuclease/ATPase MutS2
MKFSNFLFASLAILPTFVFSRELSEVENEISKLDSPEDVAKFVAVNRKEIEDKLPMMDDSTRKRLEDAFRNNATKVFDDSIRSINGSRTTTSPTNTPTNTSSSASAIDDKLITFLMLFVFTGNLLFM